MNIRCLRASSLIVGLAIFGFGPEGTAAEFFVAPQGSDRNPGTLAQPFATLERARDALRALKAAGDLSGPVTVHLRGGSYALTRPVVFTPADSGTAQAPITYAAYRDETPIVSGGRPIAGWRKLDDRVWVAEIPQVKSGAWQFRQLYVNGQKRPRARIPNAGFLRVAGCPEGTPRKVNYHTDCQTFQFKPGDIRPDWTNLSDVEVIVYHFWTDSHLPIKSVDTKSNLVTFVHKAGKVFTDDFSEDGARYIVENVFEGLDAPGEWYLNRRTGLLSYVPMPGEDPRSAAFIAPVAPAHLRLEGDAVKQQFVEHLRFRNLAFQYSHFELPRGNSNDRQGSASVPAAIVLKAARDCAFEHCRLSNLGTFAFDLMAGCSGNRFVGNEIAYVAGGGFRLDGGTERQHPLERTFGNVITDNLVNHYGEDYPSAVGVLLMNAAGNTVAHNHIHHGWYTGVSIGWVWGYQRSLSRDNVIAHNHIHDLGQDLLSDMGAIYTLGPSPGTVIRNNLIHDVDANHYGGWGIYNDEGSSHILIEDNVVYNTKFAGYNIHFAKEVTVRNNIFALGRLQQLSRSRVEPHKSVFFENNLVYWKEGELLDKNWRDKPYSFYYHPKSKEGTRETTSTFDMDWNLYFNPAQQLPEVRFNGLTWDEWRKAGKDQHSVYADPLFVAPEQFDFTLKPESPAFALGFKAIDLKTVGPRLKPGPASR